MESEMNTRKAGEGLELPGVEAKVEVVGVKGSLEQMGILRFCETLMPQTLLPKIHPPQNLRNYLVMGTILELL